MAAAQSPTPPRILEQRFEPYQRLDEIHEHAANARLGDEAFIAESIEVNGFFGAMVIDARNGDVLVGNHRYRMLVRAGALVGPALWLTPDDDAHARRIMLADNATNDRAGYDRTKLAALLAEAKAAPGGLVGTGYAAGALDDLLRDMALPRPGNGEGEGTGPRGPNLAERFGVPPFSVLDARQGYWQERKRQWIALGIRGELGRGEDFEAEVNAAPVGEGGLCDQLAPEVRVRSSGQASQTRLAAEKSKGGPRPGGNSAPAPAFGEPYTGGDAYRGHTSKVAPGGSRLPGPRAGADGKPAHGHFHGHGPVADPASYKSQARLAALQTTGDSRATSAGASSGTSVFDPVLCELVYRWFTPAGGAARILDPFGGEATKGIVAAYLGHEYTAIELRPEQIKANDAQAAAITFPGVPPRWMEGDSSQLATAVPEGAAYDLIFTSPPYYDLEIYSESEKDGSAFETFEKFMLWYRDIFRQAVDRLRPDRFLVVKIGEVRDRKTGAYRNFLGENIACFLDLGLTYYNECVLITAVGSMPVRAARPFESARKLSKGHQNVLVFYKGDPRAISAHFSPAISHGADLPPLAADPEPEP